MSLTSLSSTFDFQLETVDFSANPPDHNAACLLAYENMNNEFGAFLIVRF